MAPVSSLAPCPGSMRGSASELHADKESSIDTRDPELVPASELDSDATEW